MVPKNYFKNKFVIGSVLFLVVWIFVVIPKSSHLSNDFLYTADITSIDNFYDETIQDFLGEEYSKTNFSYSVDSVEDDGYVIKNTFNVRNTNDVSIFNVDRLYGINPRTHEHVYGLGDKDRDGYLFAPRGLKEGETFTYWHVNYDGPANMNFVKKEILYGLEVFHYRTNYDDVIIDQTSNLTYLPGVPEEKGVILEPKLDIWIEPHTGHLVKYEDDTYAYFYDNVTKEKLNPWNHFKNSYTDQSVVDHVNIAKSEKTRRIIINWYISSILVLISIFTSLIKVAKYVQGKMLSSEKFLTGMSGIVILYGLFVLYNWFFDEKFFIYTLPNGSGMNPLTSIGFILLGISFIGHIFKKRLVVITMLSILIIITLVRTLGFFEIINFNIDLILFKEKVLNSINPSRMSFFTTVNFIILSVSILLAGYSYRKSRKMFEFIPLLVLSLNIVGLGSYLLRDLDILKTSVLFSVSFPTTILFLLSSLICLYIFKFIFNKSNIILLVILTIVLFITIIFSASVENSINSKLETEFNILTDEIETKIRNRVDIYSNTLTGAVGLFDASENVSRDEWKKYVEAIQIQKNYPGIQGMGYATVVFNEEDLISQIRKEGFDDFRIYPETDQNIRTSIVYLEPFDERNKRAFGFDMYTESNRRNAMKIAQNTGRPAISGKVTLLQETNEDVQAGFLMYLPVYKKGTDGVDTAYDRKEQLIGFVYSPFRMNDLMSGIIYDDSEKITFDIHDGLSVSKESLLYVDNKELYENENGYELLFSKEKIIYVSGKPWTIEFKSLNNLIENSNKTLLPLGIFSSGLFIGLLLTIIAYVLLSSRQNAIIYAEEVTDEIRKTTQHLKEEKAKDDAILQSIGDGLIVTDTKGFITLTNRSFHDITGYDTADIFGKKMTQVISLEDEKGCTIKEIDRPIVKVLKDKQPFSCTFMDNIFFKKKNGEGFPVDMTITPILDQGNLIGAIQMFRDVTRERDIDKTKTEFVSLASHQLRTPLSAIGWYTEMLTDGDGGDITEQQGQYLNEIKNGNKRMTDLVNSLLNVSRLEMGTFVVDLKDIDVKDIISSVIKEMQPLIDSKKQKFIKNIAEKPLVVRADENLIRIIFQNIISNAIKYTPNEGDISLTVDMKRKGSKFIDKILKKKSLIISITDTGMGIPKSQHTKMFSKLFRADNVVETDVDGTGLGLYIVKSILNYASGEIWFESTEDKGTTFNLILPFDGMLEKIKE